MKLNIILLILIGTTLICCLNSINGKNLAKGFSGQNCKTFCNGANLCMKYSHEFQDVNSYEIKKVDVRGKKVNRLQCYCGKKGVTDQSKLKMPLISLGVIDTQMNGGKVECAEPSN